MNARYLFSLYYCAVVLCAVAEFGTQRASAEPRGFGEIPATAVHPHDAAVFRRAASTNFRLLHSFGSGQDGSDPHGEMIVVNGMLYGTTYHGGTNNAGTVFGLTPAGVESVLYSFKGVPDGVSPETALTAFDGELFGTTVAGGSTCNSSAGSGTVFELDGAGAENVVVPFGCAAGGLLPLGKLLSYDGALYGTTYQGGEKNGTVFVVRGGGIKKVLYSFKGEPDGSRPLGALVELGGVLYGTTQLGGTYNNGTVFAITPTGAERVVYSFHETPNTDAGASSLIVVNGVLYGTTSFGGPTLNGTLYSLTPAGVEAVLYAFKGQADGSAPLGRLVFLDGAFYGTANGGSNTAGVVFKVDMSGTETVLHDFTIEQGYDFENGLTLLNGILYGTATQGGAARKESIFEITP